MTANPQGPPEAAGDGTGEVRRRARATFVGAVFAALASGTVAMLGVGDLPWLVVLGGAMLVSLAVSAVVHAIAGPKGHRESSLWLAIATLVALLAGTWVYAYADKPTETATFTLIVLGEDAQYVSLTSEPGGAQSAFAPRLWGGEAHEFLCVYSSRGDDGDWLQHAAGGWAPMTVLRWPKGTQPRPIPECEP